MVENLSLLVGLTTDQDGRFGLAGRKLIDVKWPLSQGLS